MSHPPVVAARLGVAYVYCPAVLSLRTRRDFGNAVLSRWPIIEDSKLILPHRALFSRTQRIATAATVRVGESLVRIHSACLGTILDIGPRVRRGQLRAILADAADYTRAVVGGDMNSSGVRQVALELGYQWPTRKCPAQRCRRGSEGVAQGDGAADAGGTGSR